MSKKIKYSDSFGEILDNIIIPIELMVDKECPQEFKLHSRFERKCDFNNFNDELYDTYLTIRESFKIEYYGDSKKDKMLDAYKIASILCITILKIKLFRFNHQEAFDFFCKLPEFENEKLKKQFFFNTLYINYKSAYLVGIKYLYLTTVKKLLQSKDLNLVETGKKLAELGRFPKYQNDDHENSFEQNMIYAFYKARLNKREIDIQLLAQHFFQIEMYTIAYFENKLGPNKIF